MSLFGVEIIDRLHENCSLRDESNPMRRVIDDTIGEWLSRFDEKPFFDMFFLDSASDGYLDKWGVEYNVPRRPGESDDDYRQRLIYETLGYLTIPYLRSVYGLVVYSYSEDFDVSDNTLVSDNPVLSGLKMTSASSDVQSILSKKFVIGSDLSFIEVE